jgi:NAD(P)-dependent dehydrogenase (short-subunit alcohol dehydrogenase family)
MKLGKGISAIIAGGATGVGAATAEALAVKGCKVAILDMHRGPGEALARQLGGVYAHVEMNDETSLDEALDFVREENGIERIFVNSYRIAFEQRTLWRDHDGLLAMHDAPSFAQLLLVNLMGTFFMTAKSAMAMMQLPPLEGSNARGVIIHSASLAAEDGLEGQVAYAAGEGGIAAMTRPLARDFVGDGIRVLTIMPGRIDAGTPPRYPDDLPGAPGLLPPPGTADPLEFAKMVLMLCEDENYNGQCVRCGDAHSI